MAPIDNYQLPFLFKTINEMGDYQPRVGEESFDEQKFQFDPSLIRPAEIIQSSKQPFTLIQTKRD